MTEPALLTHDQVKARHRRALNAYVGSARRGLLPRDQLAAESGISERVLKAYQDGDTAPIHANALRLMALLPVGYANALLSQAGLGHVCPLALPDTADDGHRAMARLALEMNVLADALLDGRIDHRERLELGPRFLGLADDMRIFGMGLTQGVP